MKCCPRCFSDTFLAEQIQAAAEESATCPACDSQDVRLVELASLRGLFEPLLDLYAESPDGRPLHELLESDWRMFGEVPAEIRSEVLSEALGFDLSERLFAPIFSPAQDLPAKWDAFAEEVKYRRRFTAMPPIDKESLPDFGRLLGTRVPAGATRFYRARVNGSAEAYTPGDLGMPPADQVLNGRANPLGIPCLYLASDANTAIAEVRGHKSDLVSVLTFELNDELDLFDLRDPKTTISPFESSEEIVSIYKQLPFLELLGLELSRPITPRRANLDYLPTQYLCELIRGEGHDGILYQSSVAVGYNCVAFGQEAFDPVEMHEYRIVDVSVSVGGGEQTWTAGI